MVDSLRKILNEYDSAKYATENGSLMHAKMRAVHVKDGALVGDTDIIKNIKNRPELEMFFASESRTEVPIAAIINGKFVSRRIDRIIVDDKNKVIHILDYKTDINKDAFRANYVAQVHEYVLIVKKIYPKYTVRGYILWLHDWVLESI